MSIMHGVSRASLAAARDRLDELARSGEGDLEVIGDELFALVALLDGEGTVRRALSDPARDGRARAGLAQALFGEQLSRATLEVVSQLVRERWSSSADLVGAVEGLAVESVLAGAERAGRLDEVEDELFRFARILAAQSTLRIALHDRSLPPDRKASVINALLEGRAAPETAGLVRQAVNFPRGRTVETLLEEYGKAASARRGRLVAHVTAAVALTPEQEEHLAASLQRLYGRAIHLDVAVDPHVVGGLRVLVGDEVVDGTVATRLDEARRRFAG
jgi:F-type H+-transporting ATPase subunit delta